MAATRPLVCPTTRADAARRLTLARMLALRSKRVTSLVTEAVPSHMIDAPVSDHSGAFFLLYRASELNLEFLERPQR
jgi:hypothetical protein